MERRRYPQLDRQIGHRLGQRLHDRVKVRDEQRFAEKEESDGACHASRCPRVQRAISAGRSISCQRSEEHTSELQTLMRISYAVFCLKKKNTQNTHTQKQSYYDITQ